MTPFARLLLIAVLCWPLAAGAKEIASPEAATGTGAAKGGHAKSFMVVAANPIAAVAGADILKAGGTAVDAAITVQLVLNEVEPQSSGIGGGAFLLYWDAKTKTVSTIDGREAAPSAAQPNRFLMPDGKPMDRMTAIVGGRSVGVPGVLRLMELAHRRHGKLPWAKLFEPAIRIADDGFPLSPRLHALLAQDAALRGNDTAHAFFYEPDGSPKPVGTVLRNPALAATLRTIAEHGADVFYTGAIANDIVHTVDTAAHNPGDLTQADLRAYRAIERPPVCGPYRGYKVCGMGPPTDGGIGVIQTLRMLERFDLHELGPSAKAYFLEAEAGRLAFADRAVYIADPDVVPVPTAALLAPDYLKDRSALISVDHRMMNVEAGKMPAKATWNLVPAASPEMPCTSHFSIVDRMGNAVAMTTSIESAFGARLMVDGFLLNNTLTDFSYDDVAEGRVVANAVGPNKRPRSSMAPTLVFNDRGKLEFVLGSPGGPAIVPFVVKALVAMIDWHMTPQQAAAAPYDLDLGHGLLVETPLAKFKPALEALGENVQVGDIFPSGLHIIRISAHGLDGGADPRREGAAVGE